MEVRGGYRVLVFIFFVFRNLVGLGETGFIYMLEYSRRYRERS